jgi:hypothetical protein
MNIQIRETRNRTSTVEQRKPGYQKHIRKREKQVPDVPGASRGIDISKEVQFERESRTKSTNYAITVLKLWYDEETLMRRRSSKTLSSMTWGLNLPETRTMNTDLAWHEHKQPTIWEERLHLRDAPGASAGTCNRQKVEIHWFSSWPPDNKVSLDREARNSRRMW